MVLLTCQEVLLVFTKTGEEFTMVEMPIPTPEERPRAPGRLGDLQEFLNSGHLGDSLPFTPEETAAIAARAEAGASPGALAREYGVPHGFISALRRGSPIFDELDTHEDTDLWLREHGFLADNEKIHDADLGPLKALRELLRDFAAANNSNHELRAGAVEELNAVASANPVAVRAGGSSGPMLEPAATADCPAIARILATLFEAMRDGSWLRLKRCPGLGCPFTFYDSSRNRTGTWCSMSVCGNRTKVRKYQERRRGATA